MNQKPFAPAAEKNRHDILTVLTDELSSTSHVLELASGTGQHAVHFAQALPGIRWQPSELAENLPGIQLWIKESACRNLQTPLELDIRSSSWPEFNVDACYAANILHIINWEAVQSLFAGCSRALKPAGKLLVYGPYSIDGQHTASSNQRFDQMLKAQDPQSGVRDLAELDQLALKHGFATARLVEMPVNNFVAVWKKSP